MFSFLVSSCWQVGLLVVQPLFLVFMIDIEKDDTLIRQDLTVVANRLQATIGLPAHLAVVVDQPVLSSSHILFKLPPMRPTHLPVGNIRCDENSVDNLFNACVPPRIVRRRNTSRSLATCRCATRWIVLRWPNRRFDRICG